VQDLIIMGSWVCRHESKRLSAHDGKPMSP
jgi:hypothetical protein